MNRTEAMIKAHPARAAEVPPGVAAAVLALYDCASACASCADACVAEKDVQALRRCIRLDLDCGATCVATAEMLSRASEPDWRVVRALLTACVTACAACAEECERHARAHDHCRLCAEACRICERACRQVLARVPAVAAAV